MEALLLAGLQLQRGRVRRLLASGVIEVVADDGAPEGPGLACAFLRTSAAPPPPLGPGDAVLVAADGARGYVLGVLEPYRAGEIPRTLRFEAQERVELRCGDGAVVLRADGKVVVKGNEVVSRARGVNKVKGAAVRIN